MGYSIAPILIKEEINREDFAAFLEDCGFGKLRFDKKVTFSDAERSRIPAVQIGNYNGTTILLSGALFNAKIKGSNLYPIEEALSTTYKDRKILFIANVESAMAYYYHLMNKGKTERMKLGSDSGVEIDIGEELETEKSYYQEKYINEEGTTIYKVLNSYKNRIEEYTHDEIGGDVAFKLCSDFVGCHYASLPHDIEMDQFIE